VAAKNLTAAAVARLRPATVRREIADSGCPGLYLVVQPSGKKSWAMRFRRPSGKQGKLTLGTVDLSGKEPNSEPVMGMPLTLASARKLATEVHRQRAQGRDVIQHQQSTRAARASRLSNTFAAAAGEFIERHSKKNNRRWKKQARLLGLAPDGLELIRHGLAERWADRPVSEIDGDDVFSVVNEVRERGVPGLERRKKDGPTETLAWSMFAALSSVFSWLLEHRKVTANPCRGVRPPRPAKARDRYLSDSEIISLWHAAGAERPEFGNIIKLLLLTGCRLNEVAGMRWEELSEDCRTWTIPSQRTKNKRAHVVPLPELATCSLFGQHRGSGYVFTTNNGRTRVGSFNTIKKRLDDRMRPAQPWRIHDLRRTAATGMAGLRIAPHVIEACLNHVSGARGGVAGVYNRNAYAEEKEAALSRWANHVENLVNNKSAKVVDIAEGRRK
jgi:integrase